MTENVKYLARFRFGHASLAKLTIERETPKYLIIEECEHLIHRSYVSTRIRKDTRGLFDTMTDGIRYLARLVEEDIVEHENALVARKQQLRELRDLLGLVQERGL